MKKIVLLLVFIGCLPLITLAQTEDDLYYVPSKVVKSSTTQTVVKQKPVTRTSSVNVNQYENNNSRNVDDYNRRYNVENTSNGYSKDVNSNGDVNDTLYVKENKSKRNASDLNGKWVNGFNGSEDDYEYATRMIRFRNPRYAICISSPYYWDVVNTIDTWNWNVYDDGLYAYIFPTFSNPLWWNWSYNSYGWGIGWNYGWGYPGWRYGGWGSPYYSMWSNPYYYNGPYWGGGWYGSSEHHFAGSTYISERRSNYGGVYAGGRSSNYGMYTNNGSTNTRRSSYGNDSQNGSPVINSRRVVGGRIYNATDYNNGFNGTRQGESIRSGASDSRRDEYTRPSSTRSGSYYSVEGTRRTNSYNYRSYTRNYTQSDSPSYNRSYNNTSRRSYDYNNSSRTSRSYDYGTSTRGNSYSSGGGSSSRSYGGGGGGYSGGGSSHSNHR